MYVCDTINTTTVEILFCIFFCIRYVDIVVMSA